MPFFYNSLSLEPTPIQILHTCQLHLSWNWSKIFTYFNISCTIEFYHNKFGYSICGLKLCEDCIQVLSSYMIKLILHRTLIALWSIKHSDEHNYNMICGLHHNVTCGYYPSESSPGELYFWPFEWEKLNDQLPCLNLLSIPIHFRKEYKDKTMTKDNKSRKLRCMHGWWAIKLWGGATYICTVQILDLEISCAHSSIKSTFQRSTFEAFFGKMEKCHC